MRIYIYIYILREWHIFQNAINIFLDDFKTIFKTIVSTLNDIPSSLSEI